MARDIDRVIGYVMQLDMPSVMKQVIVNRLDPVPTSEEIERAAQYVYIQNTNADVPHKEENDASIS